MARHDITWNRDGSASACARQRLRSRRLLVASRLLSEVNGRSPPQRAIGLSVALQRPGFELREQLRIPCDRQQRAALAGQPAIECGIGHGESSLDDNNRPKAGVPPPVRRGVDGQRAPASPIEASDPCDFVSSAVRSCGFDFVKSKRPITKIRIAGHASAAMRNFLAVV